MTDTIADATALDAYLDATHEARLESLQGVPADPEHLGLPGARQDCRARRRVAGRRDAEAGSSTSRSSETTGHPVVYGDWLHAEGAPTVIVYGHYDVQPVDPLELWTSPPFEPASSATGCSPAARPTTRARSRRTSWRPPRYWRPAARSRQPQVRLRGRGGVARRHLDGWLEANRDRLEADVAIISDTGFFEGNLPAITVGLRGIMYAQIDVVGTAVDLHSGATAAPSRTRPTRWPRSSPRSRARTAGSASPGFYDDVRALTDERARGDRGPAVRRGRLPRPSSASTGARRRGRATRPSSDAAPRPTLDVNGLWGGFQGDGTKTIIPAHAHAKVSCRLVAAQDPADDLRAFRAYVEQIAPPGVTVTVQDLGGGLPSLTPTDHPATQAAARALEATFGRGAGLHPRGRLDPGLRQLRVDPRPAGRAPGFTPPTTTPMPPTSGCP